MRMGAAQECERPVKRRVKRRVTLSLGRLREMHRRSDLALQFRAPPRLRLFGLREDRVARDSGLQRVIFFPIFIRSSFLFQAIRTSCKRLRLLTPRWSVELRRVFSSFQAQAILHDRWPLAGLSSASAVYTNYLPVVEIILFIFSIVHITFSISRIC